MTRKDQIALLNGIFKCMKKHALERIKATPETEAWDGHEIREYVADLFERERTSLMKRDRKRKKEYKNLLLISNL